jgi:NAD(P)-dependent dehydrogenase (short-subunit alcohol dehydrogenase family)
MARPPGSPRWRRNADYRLTSEAEVKCLVLEALRRFGRLDVLVVNAGVSDLYKNLLDTAFSEWGLMVVRILGTHATAAHRAAPILLARRHL